MADRKLQYIIEMIADDSKIRQQMKSWDWADIMGTKGKSFGDMMADEANHGADEIKNAFKGLNIDWTQILGTKEIGQLEQALARSLQKNKIAIQDMANKKDTEGIRNTIDLMVELGKEFQAIGSNFDAGQIARSLGAFTKALQTDKIAKFVTDTEKLVNTLDKVFNGKVDVGKSLNISGTMQTSMRALKATEDEIHTAINDLKEYTNLVNKLKGAGAIDIKLGTNIKELDAQMKEWQDKADALVDARGKKKKADYNVAIKNIMAIEEARLKLGARPTEDYIGDPISDVDFPTYEKSIKRFIKTLEKDIDDLREKVNNVLGTSFAEEISKQISNIKIDLVLDEKSKAAFKKELNTFIEKLNEDKITSAKVNIDWSLNSKETNGANAQVASVENIKNAIKGKVEELNTTVTELEQSKKHFDEIAKQHIDNKEPQKATYAQGESNKLKARIAELKETIRAEQELLDLSDDPTTRQELTSMLRSFEAIQKVASAKQGEILSKTRDWRQKMTEAMSVDKKDINIQLGFDKGLEPSLNNLYNAIQNYFTENEIELHINKDAFIQEVKDAMANGGISGGTLGGGGTVNFDMASLKSAIAEGLLAALTGDFTPLGIGAPAQAGATSGGKKQNYVYLDPDTPYMKEMVNAVRQFAEYAQKDTGPAKKIRSFFDMKGVDLKSMVNASPMDIADMLGTLVGKYGETLIDSIDKLPSDVSKNNMMTAFRGELAELIHSQAIKQTTVDDETRRLQSIDVFNNLVEKARMLAPFNTKSHKWKMPDVTAFDDIFSMATGKMDKTSAEYTNASKALESVKSIIANEEGLDAEAQKEKLQAAIEEFKASIQQTYTDLSMFVSAFEMDVFVKGSKKPYRAKGMGVLGAQDMIGDDPSKLQDVHMYKDISTGALGTTRRRQELKMIGGYNTKTGIIVPMPDRTDILNKDTTIEEWRTREIVEEEIQKVKADLAKFDAEGNSAQVATSRRKLGTLEQELKDFTSYERWQDDDTAAKRAENRATQATKLLAQSEARATELASAEAEIQKQIEEKTQQKTSLENEITQNQEAIAKANDNPRKLAGARTRLANRKAALDAAQAERDAAKDNKDIINSMDHSSRDRELADINAARVRYESWKKNIDKWMSDPEAYNDEYSRVTEELYGKDLRTAKVYREDAQKNIDSTKWQITTKDKDISDIQSDIKQFGDTPEKQRKLELAIKQREQYVKQLQQYEEEYAKQDAEIKRIRAKIYGYTEADTEAFRADFQGYMSKEFQKLDERETKLGADPRAQAEARLAAADKAVQKAQQEYDKVASSDEAKRAIEVDQLRAKNQELTSQVKTLATELKSAKNKRTEITDKMAAETATQQLALGPQKAEVESLINQTEQLNKDIYQAKQDADELDKKVQEAMGAEGYKKPKYDIAHAKANQNKVNKYRTLKSRKSDLTKIADDKYTADKLPETLTANMRKIVDSLANSRTILKTLSSDFGLDKFDTDEALVKEIQTRLTNSANGKNKLNPLIEEFYNKIISDGKLKAQQWLDTLKGSHSQNITTQENKLRKLAENDSISAKELEPAVVSAEKSLNVVFRQRTNQWLQNIQSKLASINSGKLNAEEKALTIKEVDELFKLVQQAEGQYSSKYKTNIEEAVDAQKIINTATRDLAEKEKQLAEVRSKINLEDEEKIREQIKIAQSSLKEYQEKRKIIVEEANAEGKKPDLSFIDNGIAQLEKTIDELYAQSNLRKEQEIQKQIQELRKKIKTHKKVRKSAVNKAQPWSDGLLNSNLEELENAKTKAYEKGNFEEATRIQEQIRKAHKNIKAYEIMRKKAEKEDKSWSLSALEAELRKLEEEKIEANKQGELKEEKKLNKQIKKTKHAIQVFKEVQLLQQTPLALHKDYSYGSYLNSISNDYTSQRDAARAELEAKMAQREPLLQTRQAELLRDIETATKAGDTEAVKKLEVALTEVNEELARYYQYHQLLKSSKIVDVLADDTEFVSRLSKHLYDGALLGYNADLDKAKGMSNADLNSKYYTVLDQQQQQIYDEVYDKLQTKQTTLLKDIETLSKDGKDAKQLVTILEAVNQELVEYELNKRRAEDIKLGGKAYKADVEVMRVYNEETRKLIEAEQKLAIAQATGIGVEDARSAKNKQRNITNKNIQKAQTDRENREASGGARAKALEYLTETERAYTTALEQRAALNRRMRIKESQIENIENDSKYSTSWQYKQHQRVVKDRLINEYVGSDDYHNDRGRGIAKVKSEMMSYLERILPPEAAEKVLSQFITPEGELGDKINLDAMQETFDNILRDSAEYQRYLTDREAEYNRILGAERGTIHTDNTVFNLMVDEMHKYRDALAIGAEDIEAVKQANIKMLQTVSEDDYEPLKKEMQKVKSRVNLDTMVAGFKDVIADPKKNKSREATINNLKSQVLQAGGNQTEANRLAEELNNIGDTALRDVKAWSQRFLPQIFHTTEDEFREEARRNLIANEETYAKTELAALQRNYDMSEKHVRAMFAGETSRGADSFTNKYLGDWINQLGTDGAFEGLAEGTVTDIVTQFKALMEENVFNLVSKYGESLVVKDGMLGGINIREEVKKQLLAELHGTTQKSEFTGEEIFIPGYEQKAQEINANIAHIEAQRKAAMKYGGISSGEVVDAEVLREQAMLVAKLTTEKEKQQALTAEITRLEAIEGSSEELGRLNAELDETNKKVTALAALVDNSDNLLGILQRARTEEEAEKRLTPEEKRAWFANKLEVAKANLDSDDEAVRKLATEQIARYTAKLDDINTKIATEEAERRKDSSVIGMMTKALRDAFGGKGGFALDATGVATEATLSQILQILTGVIGALGGEVVRDPEMEKKLARMRELEAKRGVVSEAKVNKTTSDNTKKTNEKNPIAEEMIKRIKAEVKEEKDLPKLIKTLVDRIKPENKGTKEDTEDRFRLHRAFAEYKEQNKNIPGVPTYKDNKGELQHSYKELAKHLGVEGADQLRIYENNIHELANTGFVEGQKQVENEKAKTAESQKQVENEKEKTILKPVLDSNKKEVVAGTNTTDLKSGQKDAYAKYIGRNVGNYKPSDAIFSDEKALKAKVKELQGIMTTSATDSEEYLKAMVEMSRLISTWRNVVKQTKPEMKDNAKWQEYLTKGKGKLFDKKEDVPLGGITSTSKVILKQIAMNLGTKISEDAKNELFVAQEVAKTTKEEVKPAQQKAEAKEREVAAEVAITEEKKEQKAVGETKGGWTNAEKAEYDKLAKETAGYSPKVTFGEGGNLGGLALESTLQEILTVIRNIQANGIKKGGGSGSGRSKPKDKTEADLIKERTLKQDEAVRGLAAGRGGLYDRYAAEVEVLNKAVDAAKKNKKAVNINAVKTAAEKVSALTRNILRDTAEWDYMTAQSDAVWDVKLAKDQKMTQERMEKEAQKTFDKKKEKYEFLGFDGDTLTYQLTDLEGKVRQVTMVWNDFNQQMAITSDKTTNKLDPVAEKVEKLKEKFEDAKAAGYLNADDAGLTKFADKLAEIGNAKTFEDVERLRKETIALGDGINKTINNNKRWMVGTGAKKSVDNQYNKIFGAIQAGGFEDSMAEDSVLLDRYLTKYNALNSAYETYAKNNQLNNPKIQQELQQQANAVQILGKKYLASVQEANELLSRVDRSGTFKDKKTGQELSLGGTKSITPEEVKNLKSVMESFVQTELKQFNIESAKFDPINQKMVYGFRINADTVAEMEVKYNDATKALYAYQVREKESLTGFKGFMQSMRGKMRSILQYTASITSIYRVLGELRRGIQYIREIDSALTELKKVTDETEESYERFLNTAAKTADKVGSTIKEVVSSTADWARIGYSLQDAATLAESTAILLNVSEFQSIDDATSALTSTLQAFGYTANQSMDVVDVLNEVGNNFAISSDGIATALQDSASSLMAANNSYQESVALIAAANRVVILRHGL